MTTTTRRRLIDARILLRETCDALHAAERAWDDMAPGMKAQDYAPAVAGPTRPLDPDDPDIDGRSAISDPTGNAAVHTDQARRDRDELAKVARRLENLARQARDIVNRSAVDRPATARELHELAVKARPGCDVMGRIEKPGGGTYFDEGDHIATTVGGRLTKPMTLGTWAYDFVRKSGRLPTDTEARAHGEGRRVMVTA